MKNRIFVTSDKLSDRDGTLDVDYYGRCDQKLVPAWSKHRLQHRLRVVEKQNSLPPLHQLSIAREVHAVKSRCVRCALAEPGSVEVSPKAGWQRDHHLLLFVLLGPRLRTASSPAVALRVGGVVRVVRIRRNIAGV